MIHVAHCEPHGVPLYVCRTCDPLVPPTTTDDGPWTWTVRQDVPRRRDGWLVVAAIVVLAAVAVAWRVAK